MALKTLLLTLVLTLLHNGGLPAGTKLPDNDPIMLRAAANAAAIEAVTEKIVKNPIERETWARIAFVFGYFEASWLSNPKGSNGNRAPCGLKQGQNPEKFLPGPPFAQVRKEQPLGYEVGITLMMQLEAQCGSKAAALTAFATNGTCPKGWTLPLIKRRCKMAGLTEECRPKAA